MAKPDGIRPVSMGQGLIRMMVVGIPGAGKSPLAGTSPRGIVFRPPTESSVSMASLGSTCDEWVFTDWSDMDDIKEYMRNEGHRQYSWWWLDNITLAQEVLLDDVFEDVVLRKGQERAQFGPDRGEYGVNMHRLGKWVRDMLTVPTHMGITAHPLHYTDSNGQEWVMPGIQGKNMPEKICGYMNLIGHLHAHTRKGTTKEYRVLTTRINGIYYAKDQFNALGGRMVSPTIPKIEAAVQAVLPERPRTRKTRRSTS